MIAFQWFSVILCVWAALVCLVVFAQTARIHLAFLGLLCLCLAGLNLAFIVGAFA